MKVTVYGFGSLNYYLNKLRVPERLGGEPPYGGSAMAIEFAKAGYDVTLADPHLEKLPREIVDKVEKAGVKLTTDDVEAAKGAEVAILFTPFRSGITFKVAETIVPHLAENAVICTTCTMSILVLNSYLQNIIFMEGREDIGFSTMHPAAIPGTPQHKHYLIATNELLKKPIVTQEQIDNLKNLAIDAGKKVYLLPAELVSAVGDMGIITTAIAFTGAVEYYRIARDVLKTKRSMTEFQIAQSLQVVSSIVARYGFAGLIKLLNVDAMKDSLKSMILEKNEQPLTVTAVDILEKIGELIPEVLEEAEKFEPSDSVYMSAPSPMLVEYMEDLVGDDVLKGILRESWKKFYEGISERD
ncbi:H(2)-dependent methylenetetrahydromethanopterin dehydrogenase-related protein [Desulfurobacterium atlanticum]|uniref:H2-forming N(5),N(10)-methenyltetrahydromethanopterin dehydrogenase-related protein n=1 Tax=Desulfurobacterium atlanticum TaxID=240169 RepID=A0A239A566_9BACT|nr:H(2)-dependent methylenetetrahydromethanopterin dehydrogenase-related protein [Desulfurobacterium atlanticum]SNR90441.1 H2-forming N(5),N(10)-methenyltetrahydromethanopterin dehydrogenase-related protein [Desulfurobacterium atlanticum]